MNNEDWKDGKTWDAYWPPVDSKFRTAEKISKKTRKNILWANREMAKKYDSVQLL